MSLVQDWQQKLHFVKSFTATGIIGAEVVEALLARRARVVVENVGGTNEVVVRGRIKGQTAFQTLSTITGPSSGTTVDTSLVDELQFECTTYDASGAPKLIASGFFAEP